MADAATLPYNSAITAAQMSGVSSQLNANIQSGTIPQILGNSVLAFMLGWGAQAANTSKTIFGQTYIFDGTNWNLTARWDCGHERISWCAADHDADDATELRAEGSLNALRTQAHDHPDGSPEHAARYSLASGAHSRGAWARQFVRRSNSCSGSRSQTILVKPERADDCRSRFKTFRLPHRAD